MRISSPDYADRIGAFPPYRDISRERHISEQPSFQHSVPVTRSSSISLEHQSLSATPASTLSLEHEPEEVHQQLQRLRHYSTVRELEVTEAFQQQEEDDDREALEIIQRNGIEDNDLVTEASSVRTMLAQILQRLDARNVGHAIQGQSGNVLKNTVLDPFGIGSVQITPKMDSALRHCK